MDDKDKKKKKGDDHQATNGGEGVSAEPKQGKRHAFLQKFDELKLRRAQARNAFKKKPYTARDATTGSVVAPPSAASSPALNDKKGISRSTSEKKKYTKMELQRSVSLSVSALRKGQPQDQTQDEAAGGENDEDHPVWGLLMGTSVADFSRQDLQQLPDEAFGKNTTAPVEILDFHANKITKLPSSVGDLSSLTVLSGGSNLLTKLPKSVGKLQKLIIMDFHNNRLTKLPKSIGKLKRVSKLHLSNNRFPSFPVQLTGMTELQVLHLSNNFLLSLPPEIGTMKNLKVLRLDNNHIRFLPEELWKMEGLDRLELEGNDLAQLPANLSGLKNLLYISVGYNRFNTIPPGIFTLPKIETISVRGSNLEAIPTDIKKVASTLKEFILTSNRLTDLPEEFRLLKGLELLDMRGNPLGQLGFGQGKWKTLLIDMTALKSLLTGAAPGERAAIKIKPKVEKKPDPAPTDGDDDKDWEALQGSNGSITTVRRGATKGGGRRAGNPFAQPAVEGDNTFEMFKNMSLRGGALKQLEDAGKEAQDGSEKSPRSEQDSEEDTDEDESEPASPRLSDAESDTSESTAPEEPVAPPKEADVDDLLTELDPAHVIARKEGLLVQEFGAVEDINKAGLQRAKKDVMQQEDAHCEHLPLKDAAVECALFCIFDGHGGKEASTAATTIIPEEVRTQIKAVGLRDDAAEVLHRAFLIGDDEMRKFQYEGCTATAVLVWTFDGERYLQAANCGDSAAFVNCGRKVIHLTRDHKLSEPTERSRMSRAGVAVGERQTRIGGGIAITRALGDHFAKDNDSGMIGVPYISEPVRITNEVTHLIVASDGLWDVMTGRRALDLARTRTASDAAEHIMKAALSKKDCKDNISVTVVRL